MQEGKDRYGRKQIEGTPRRGLAGGCFSRCGRRGICRIDWNRRFRHPFLILLFFLLIFSIYGFSRVHASEGPREDSIIPSNYHDEGDTSQWPLDLRYATNTASRTIYRDGKIYLQLYSCSWNKNSWSGDYILRYFIRKSDGTVIWLPDVDRGAMLNDWSNVQNVLGVTLHKSFWMAPMELPGAKPEVPEAAFENQDNYQVSCTLTGKANTAAGTYHYDYHAYHRTKKSGSFVPDGGNAANATDFLTGIWYRIDEQSGNVPFSGFQPMTSGDASGRTTAMKLDIPSRYVNSERIYYLHLVSQSYTGQYSDMKTVAIPSRGVHRLRYDRNGGSGNFPEQTVAYGKEIRIHDTAPRLEGHTFTGWSVAEDSCCPGHLNRIYQPGEVYEHRQESGTVTLKAGWRPNRYRLIYHGNERGGLNGKVTGTMPEEDRLWTDTGISENVFQNETLQEDGRPRFRFLGWAMREDAIQADIPADAAGRTELEALARAAGTEHTDGAEIHLYAVWDKAPEISGNKNAYFNYAPGPEELLQLISAADREDLQGRVFQKSTESLSLTDGWKKEQADRIFLLDWTGEELEKLGECGSTDINFRAMDSGGNLSDYTVTVWILSDGALKDTSIPDPSGQRDLDTGRSEKSNSSLRKHSYVRFIDADNYRKSEKNGGLRRNSVWRKDNGYREALEKCLIQF